MSSDDVHTDFSKAMSYGDYLDLDTLLLKRGRRRSPLSDQHDEPPLHRHPPGARNCG